MNDLIDLEIPNWAKYQNGKKSEKYTSLMSFRLASNFFSDSKIMRLSGHAKLLFIFILSECANRNSGYTTFSMQKATLALSFKRFSGHASFLELESFQLVRKIHAHNKIKVNRIKEKEETAPPKVGAKLDYDALYEIYPRKEGKRSGLLALGKKITTPEQFNQVKLGIENYSKKCRDENTGKKYIKHFSTFINQESWLEFQDYSSPSDLNDEQISILKSLQVRPPREVLSV